MKTKKNDFMDDLYKVREKISRKLARMTPEKRVIYMKKRADELQKKYGFKTMSLERPKSTIYDTNLKTSQSVIMEKPEIYETKNKK